MPDSGTFRSCFIFFSAAAFWRRLLAYTPAWPDVRRLRTWWKGCRFLLPWLPGLSVHRSQIDQGPEAGPRSQYRSRVATCNLLPYSQILPQSSKFEKFSSWCCAIFGTVRQTCLRVLQSFMRGVKHYFAAKISVLANCKMWGICYCKQNMELGVRSRNSKRPLQSQPLYDWAQPDIWVIGL